MNSFLNSLELRFGRFAIPGLIRYIAILNGFVFILYKLGWPVFSLLDLNSELVLRGEIWRLVTYIFIPGIGSLLPMPDWINAAFYVLFLWWIGDGLDQAWGEFRTNLFYLVGMIGTTIAAFVFGAQFSNLMLNSSLFFAFARFYPDLVIYMFYVLPMKIKWMAWITCAWLLVRYAPYGASAQMALAAAFLNYIIFFGQDIVQDARQRGKNATRRKRFERDVASSSDAALHSCAVCKRTEITNPHLDFRVAKDGNEYCTEHLPSRQQASQTNRA